MNIAYGVESFPSQGPVSQMVKIVSLHACQPSLSY